ncbi:Low-density lipoprotein receptor repeat class B [Popillia japonica]|uniref:Low-density lipoprotein receptor-related protein 2 n=1 Tax=Popillia japonica TaxID=7064 RepID=A0AAW1HTG1_POPJA
MDNSSKIVGAVLMQKGKPISYAAEAFSPAQQRYPQIEKEALAISFDCNPQIEKEALAISFDFFIITSSVVTKTKLYCKGFVAHPCKTNNGNCSHICATNWNRNIAIAKCLCASGYILQSNGDCTTKVASSVLLIGRKKPASIKGIDPQTGQETMIPITDIKPMVMDVNVRNNTIYYLEDDLSIIQSISISTGKRKQVLKRAGEKCLGLAYDWAGENLFWTVQLGDTGSIKVVKLADVSKARTLLIDRGVFPTDIVLNPKRGYMFWVQSALIQPVNGTLYRSWMDGSNREVFVDTDIGWPNGLAIDLAGNRLYWSDTSKGVIESIGLNKEDRQVVVSNIDVPFRVDFFNNVLFYIEYQKGLVMSFNMETHAGGQLDETNTPAYLKILDYRSQRDLNECTNNKNCTEICLAIPTGINCSCSDGFHMINSTCVEKNGSICGSNEFVCKSTNLCIPNSKLCDGNNDCGDLSDEDSNANGPCRERICNPFEFSCDNKTKCVMNRWLCDGDKDCVDGSDENSENCPGPCSAKQFTCHFSRRCIPYAWVCDTIKDCGFNDSSDELNCDTPKCDVTEFTCNNSKCIMTDMVCDGFDDCQDGSDEINCTICKFDEVLCMGNQSCLPTSLVCNGHPDCPDGSDEMNCRAAVNCAESEFACESDGTCIPKMFQCDSFVDCVDGSDELKCDPAKMHHTNVSWTPTPPTSLTCEHPSRFCDNSTVCIGVEQLCDGQLDCQDMSDEGLRCKEQLCLHSFICSHTCHNAPEGVVCSCPPELHLQPDQIHCLDTHPCEAWGVCSQECKPMGSRYKCECLPEYSLADDGFTCKSVVNATAIVIFSNRHELRGVDLHRFNVKALISNLKNTIALDFYHTDDSDMIYWTDVIDDKIYRGTLVGNLLSNIEVVVQTGLSTAEGLAVDWIGENLYWVESNLDQIEVARLNGSFRRTLIGGEMESPRAIALDPRLSYLFWTDWDTSAPRIERSSLAGLGRKVIVRVDRLASNGAWPNGLTLDYDHKRIYWIDARSDSIHTTDYDGLDHHVVMKDHDLLSHPFAITLFENYVYWTDWRTNSVVRANKWTGGDVSVIQRTLSQPFDIQVFHPSRQPRGRNPCGTNNGGCSHLCLLHTNSTYRCDCPHVMRLHTDNRTCVVNERVLLIARVHEIRGVDLLQPYYHTIPTISNPQVMSAYHIEYLAANNTVYWTDYLLNEVKRSGLTMAQTQILIDTGLDHPTGLAVDWLAKNLFVGSLKGIIVCNLNGEYSSIVIKDTSVESIAIDPIRGRLFWVSTDKNVSQVESSFMNGLNRSILAENLSPTTKTLTYDKDANRLYWISSFKIYYYDFTTGTVINVNLPNVTISAATIYQGLIYYANDDDSTIHIANKTTGENDRILRNSTGVLALRIYDPNEQIGSGPCDENKSGCQHLCIPISSIEKVCKCATGYLVDTQDPTKCVGDFDFIFYSNSWEICGLNMDGSNDFKSLGPISRVSMASSIDFLANEDLIFWTDSDHGVIRSIARDGTQRRIIIDQHEVIENTASDILTGLAVDWSAGNIYWSDPKHGVIEVARLNGSSRYVILSHEIGKPTALAIDPAVGLLVWAGGTKIESAALDGSNRYLLVDQAVSISDITLDYTEKLIYFCDTGKNTIERITYNGSNREVLLNHSLENPAALSFMDNILYWDWGDTTHEHGSIKMAHIDDLANYTKLMAGMGDSLKDIQIFSKKRQQGLNACAINNGGCQHLCLYNGSHPVCACPHGKVAEDGKTCEEYKSFVMFSKVVSIDSIHLTDANVKNSPFPSIRSSIFMKNAIGLSYDYMQRRIFYSDIQKGSLNTVFFNGSGHSIIVDRQGSVEGLVFEQVHRALYWTCNNDATISRVNLTLQGTNATKVEVVIKLKPQDKPRGIAVDSCGSRLYWTNWNSYQPTIERAYLSGFGRQIIISTDIRMPNAITLDHQAQKVYWSDARLDKIERCEYDGTDRIVLSKATPQHAFALAIYGDYIYWTDWVLHAVLRADKLTGQNLVYLRRDVEKPMGIIAVANDTNDCLKNPCLELNGGCEETCSLNADGSVKCTCSDDKILAEDKKRCYSKSFNCREDSFRCSDGGCVPFQLTCDGLPHCIDASDEEPGYCGHRTCPQGWFSCLNKRCILANQHCNGVDECGDSSDEVNCSCPDSHRFKCETGQCILKSFVCDRDPDCVTATDEKNCPPQNCTRKHNDDNFINCPTTTACIHKEWLCDGENDCWDWSDEKNCSKPLACKPSEFQCPWNGRCISKQKVCDQKDDCHDAANGWLSSDEKNCPDVACGPHQFMCTSDFSCIPLSLKCNGNSDCLDNSDEHDCKFQCKSEQFQCGSGECIPVLWQCDGHFDCNDNSDEGEHCRKRQCHDLEFRCNSTGQCISTDWVCDGEIDCREGEDEHVLQGCPPTFCGPHRFQCADRTCIMNQFYCDGDYDCRDKSDEPEHCFEECAPGEFECRKGHCILEQYVCDGKRDCPDGNDEGRVCISNQNYCQGDGWFTCMNGVCINSTLLCNAEDDCGDYSDETLCNINECDSTTKPCSDICIDKPIGYECACPPGYKINPDKPNKCHDVDECEERPCSQICKNTVGSFHCSCTTNYILRPDMKSCRANTTIAPKLILANRYYIRKLDLMGDVTLLVHNLTNAVALDFDWQTQCFFWSDVTRNGSTIKKLCGNTYDTPAVTLHSATLQNPDGLAVDWVGRNIYWCDKGLDTLEVSTIDGKYRRVLVAEGLEEPRAVALNPLKGYMYWSDWGKDVHIGKAGMDGSNPQMIIRENLGWPNSLTIDYETEELFWADAREDYIAVSDLNGNNIRIIASRTKSPDLKLHHVFAITVWEDYIYWSDWETKSVERCHKYLGNQTKTLSAMVHRPMDLRIYHPFRQPDRANPCENANCSALCLITPRAPYYRCTCPENFVLAEDGHSCISNCTSAHFECATTFKCIPFWWKCDTQNDCGDGSDEPETCRKFKCKPGEFQCDNEMCLHPSNLCNGKDDCGDKSDEKNCHNYTCLNTQFRCKGNDEVPPQCIANIQRCNKQKDCPLGEDEMDCPPVTCPPNQFKCQNDKCIPVVWLCDKDNDCGDNSDEFEGCENRTCLPDQIKCSSGRCIPVNWQCDGDPDCSDGGDEPESCTQPDFHTCDPTYFKCDNNKCIPGRWHCDYDNDCGDGSDEVGCKPRNCSESEFRCKNGRCIAGPNHCDGEYHCDDMSDEENCETTCTNNEFPCTNPKLCIYREWKCDGDIDCADGSDELNCSDTCADNGFKCTNGLCINEQWKCDGQDDCHDNSDEDPKMCAHLACSPGHFRCLDNTCISSKLICNGVDDCKDGSDESPITCKRVHTCASHEFKCANGHCIEESEVCDGENDCVDNSDENDCEDTICNWNTCSQLCFKYTNNSHVCKCSPGFHKTPDGGCQAYGEPPTLVLVVEAELRLMSPYKAGAANQLIRKQVLTNAQGYKVDTIDVFHKQQQLIVFWTNNHNKRVESMLINPSERYRIERDTTIRTVLSDLKQPRGLAVDWITHKIYVTDLNRILVSTFNGSQSYTLISGDMSDPRDIVLAPAEGLLFWADWGPKAVIETAYMDGNKRRVLVDDIIWPTGLAIDYPKQRLYWADPKARIIASINFNGTAKHITHQFNSDIQPYKIEVFEDYLYVTTQYTHNVFRLHKFGQTTNNTHLAMGLPKLQDILILQENRQDHNITDRCHDFCHSTEFCLLSPSGATCTCADGFEKYNLTCRANTPKCPLNCNLGKCEIVEGKGPRCFCPPEYTGELCEHYRCSQFCRNKGQCYIDHISVQNPGSPSPLRCSCPPQWTGEHCETPVNICEGRCFNGGTCYSSRPGPPYCSCKPGFTGPKCQNCLTLTCMNGGVCTKEGSKEICKCALGYRGDHCEIFVCDAFCSKNGGCFVSATGPKCRCNPGYSGRKCEEDTCVQNCQNGGTCIMGTKQLECKCPPMYIGRRCQTHVCSTANPPDVCRDNASCNCLNGGSCTWSTNGFHCECLPGWIGKQCESYFDNSTRCPLECLNGGQCAYIKSLGEAYCACRKPYQGHRCQLKFMCIPSCQNGGECENTDSGPYCKCPPAFEGPACENIITIKMPESDASSDHYGFMLNIVIAMVLLVLVLVAVGATFLFLKKRRLFSHERLQENDFSNPTYQDRDAEPFTLAADRSNNFVNPVYESVYNGNAGVKEEKTGLLQKNTEEIPSPPTEEL